MPQDYGYQGARGVRRPRRFKKIPKRKARQNLPGPLRSAPLDFFLILWVPIAFHRAPSV